MFFNKLNCICLTEIILWLSTHIYRWPKATLLGKLVTLWLVFTPVLADKRSSLKTRPTWWTTKPRGNYIQALKIPFKLDTSISNAASTYLRPLFFEQPVLLFVLRNISQWIFAWELFPLVTSLFVRYTLSGMLSIVVLQIKCC